MSNADAVRRFFRTHGATAVGATPPQPEMPTSEEDDKDAVVLDVEVAPDAWRPLAVTEAPARPGESPERFIDGSHAGHAVLCLRAPGTGWPVPVMLSEVGAVAIKVAGRSFTRGFVGLERVLSFVADPFPWEEVEALAAALADVPDLPLRVLPANPPGGEKNPFDYEVMRKQAQNRSNQEMANWEALALAADRTLPTLVDGRLEPRLRLEDARSRPLVVGVVKQQSQSYLHPAGWRALLDLKPGQRTPVFQVTGRDSGDATALPVASWYLKLAGGPRLAPNWGYVRVEVPWVQFERFERYADRFGFVNRLSRWLIDARCRQESYARMPVSLEPIVRAEETLKPLFTPFSVLANRLYRHAGVIWSQSHE
jgi:hypothetical protein